MRRAWALVPALALAIMVLVSPFSLNGRMLTPAQAQNATQYPVERSVDNPVRGGAVSAAPQLSASQLEALQLRKLQLRDRMAASVDNNPPSPPGITGAPVAPSTIGAASRVHGDPAAFVIARNTLNTQASMAGNSTLAEPAAAANGSHIIASGNFAHAEFSTNGGLTWTSISPLPAGPGDAPTPCCGDSDLVFDDGRRVVFHSQLYLNAGLTHSLVRIFIRRAINAVAANCWYDIYQTGPTDTILMDYPHLGLSSNFLYLASNDINTATGAQVARMRRWHLDDLMDCAPAVRETFGFASSIEGQRVIVPAEGTNTQYNMYWAINDNSTTIRLFRWREVDAAVSSVTRVIGASTFGDPDCRGGVGNFDYIRSLNGSITGFNVRSAYGAGRLGVWWQVAADASHTQGHIHAALFREDPLPGAVPWNPVLISQPHIFNNAFCFGYPQPSSNKRGDFGMVLAFGGVAGGGGSAANGAVGIDDDFSSGGSNGAFGIFFATTSGDQNRSDSRYGDYFTLHAWEPCEKFFIGTSFGRHGTTVADVEVRITEFGRNRDYRCWSNWANRRPIPQP